MDERTILLTLPKNATLHPVPNPIDPKRVNYVALLPFSEVAKLDFGNANVRRPTDTKPLKDMLHTAETKPWLFHEKNQGISYLCLKVEFDKNKRTLKVRVPRRGDYGIINGGHTYEAVSRTVKNMEALSQQAGWSEPFVEVKFKTLAENKQDIPGIVKGLNTSKAVKDTSFREYSGDYEHIKAALKAKDFDLKLVAFRENEPETAWTAEEICQRVVCSMKDKWTKTPPASMYRSKAKAVSFLCSEEGKKEFEKLQDVLMDIITFPEYIQSEFSRGKVLKGQGRKLGKLKCAKVLSQSFNRPGTPYVSEHKLDLAALLPMASAFRELLVLKDDEKYRWRYNPKEAFKRCASDLYDVLANRSARVKTASQLGSDIEYWGTCANLVMRVKDQIAEEKGHDKKEEKPEPKQEAAPPEEKKKEKPAMKLQLPRPKAKKKKK